MNLKPAERLPYWLNALWWPIFTGALIFLVCLLNDPNGYGLVHNYFYIFLPSVLCFFLSPVWLIGTLILMAYKRIRLYLMGWLKIILLAAVFTLICIRK